MAAKGFEQGGPAPTGRPGGASLPTRVAEVIIEGLKRALTVMTKQLHHFRVSGVQPGTVMRLRGGLSRKPSQP
jgi:hypothetical protein